MPVHNHNFAVSTENGVQGTLNGQVVLGKSIAGTLYQTNTTQNLVQMNFQALSIAGGSLPHNNMSPFLTLLYCIALQGVFPPRT